jgi:tetratricopeptide (TPR) repeat protein
MSIIKLPLNFSLRVRRIAYKVKLVKWLLTGIFWAIFATSLVRADAAGDLENQGTAAMTRRDYKAAAGFFDQIINNYPSTPNLDEIRLDAGLSYLYTNDYAKAIDRLTKETADNAPAQYHAGALYYTGYAQLLAAGKLTDPSAKKAMFAQSIASNSKLITYAIANPTTDNHTYLELGYYNRALGYEYTDDLTNAEKDVSTLLAQFGSSLQKPDYLVLLGNLYAQEANEGIQNKKPDDAIRAAANNALQAFDQAAADPNALVQANDAKLAKAETLYLLASMTPADPAGYQRALDAFREVRRKADLIPLQQQNVDALRAANSNALQTGGAGSATENSRIIERESGRLETLKNEPDPIIQALIRIAQCYNSMQQGDEARTVLHRLASADLTPEQHQEVDFALIYSYVLGGEAAKADQALTAYLAKHPGDAEAEGISVQIGTSLMKRGDANGALAQANRSLSDFPKGRYVADAIQLKVEALTALGRMDEADKVGDEFIQQHPDSPNAVAIILSRAQRQTAAGNLEGALASYQKVRDSGATPEIQAAGDAGYIQTLESLGKLDEVIQESKAFAAKYPNSPELPSVLVMSGVAMDQKHDPGAVAALQDEARKFPDDTPNSPSPFALFYIVNIYQRAGQIPQMVQAADDLKKAFPNEYTFLEQAAETVSDVYVKEKKFDEAVAEYQSLVDAPNPAVSAAAANKVGGVWLSAAKAMGAYQSMQQESERTEAEKRLGAAEQSYLGVLKNHPDQLAAVDDAFTGLDNALIQRRSWGLIKQVDFEDYFTKLTADLTDPAMQTRLELAKAGFVFIDKNGTKKYPQALARFKAAIAANPTLALTRTEADRYGELLIAGQDYPTAIQVYSALQKTDPRDDQVQADADYGLGATYFAQGNYDQAKTYFTLMKGLRQGAAWHPHIMDANYALAFIAEKSGQPGDLDSAKQTYAQLMQSPDASVELQAKAILGYGRILQQEGHTTAGTPPNTDEDAVHYFQQVDTIYGPAVPELSAEGLYEAGQIYDKAGDKANAKKEYQSIITNYPATTWAVKAQAAVAQD